MNQTDSLKELSTQIYNCTACPLFSIPVNPLERAIETQTRLMVISENPSAEEHLLNAPWHDRHHYYVRNLITPIFPLNNSYYTYLVKCSTTECIGIKNSKPCRELFLEKEINLLKPKIILTLGQKCGKILMGKFAKEIKPGEIFVDNYPYGTVAMSNWSAPSVILNQGTKKEKDFIKFIEKLRNLLPSLN